MEKRAHCQKRSNVYVQLQKQVEKWAFGKHFWPVWQWVQINYIFINNIHILCLFCNVKKFKLLPNCLKRAETNIIVIVFSDVLNYVFILLPFSLKPVHGWGVLDTTLSDQVSSTNKTDCNDITEILLKVVLNTLTQTLTLPHIFNIKDI